MCNTWNSRYVAIWCWQVKFEIMHCVLYICQFFPIYKIASDHNQCEDPVEPKNTYNSCSINTFDVSAHKISLMSYVMQQLNNEMLFWTSNEAAHVWSVIKIINYNIIWLKKVFDWCLTGGALSQRCCMLIQVEFLYSSVQKNTHIRQNKTIHSLNDIAHGYNFVLVLVEALGTIVFMCMFFDP